MHSYFSRELGSGSTVDITLRPFTFELSEPLAFAFALLLVVVVGGLIQS